METQSRPALFYKHDCPPCQWMSRLAVILSLGVIRRVPLDSAEAKELYRKFPEHEGQLVLIGVGRPVFGRMVFAALPRTVLVTWATDIRGIVLRLTGRAPSRPILRDDKPGSAA
jgi:hypothetical protein